MVRDFSDNDIQLLGGCFFIRAVFQGNRTDRTDLNTGKAFVTRKCDIIGSLFTVKGDHCIKTAPCKGQERLTIIGLADMYALPAQNAPVGIIIQNGVLFVYLRFL